MLALLEVVMPVFLVAGAGYLAVRLNYFSDGLIDGLNRFAQGFAIPCLLFKATMSLDLAAVFDLRLLVSYYGGSTLVFLLGSLGARYLFNRRPGESIAIGFGALFPNSVILGIPITARAFDAAAVDAQLAIVAVHAPYCWIVGITAMEVSRADGRGLAETTRAVIKAVLHNALMVGLALGFAVNLLGIGLPGVMLDAIDLIVASALPAALIGLGGILTRYSISKAIPEAVMTSTLSLLIHPAITWCLAVLVFDLPAPFVQAAVLTAAMAPGVNAYVFASIYGRAVGAAASTVLLATLISVLTVSAWLSVLPPG